MMIVMSFWQMVGVGLVIAFCVIAPLHGMLSNRPTTRELRRYWMNNNGNKSDIMEWLMFRYGWRVRKWH